MVTELCNGNAYIVGRCSHVDVHVVITSVPVVVIDRTDKFKGWRLTDKGDFWKPLFVKEIDRTEYDTGILLEANRLFIVNLAMCFLYASSTFCDVIIASTKQTL